ncbi:hypothetical protein ACFZB6_16330 [Streptomyces syringium]|uniref:hypothetical protein n=1 Tax=Streptomyces syringium TaxID=76729 RepID=UPI0033B6DA96
MFDTNLALHHFRAADFARDAAEHRLADEARLAARTEGARGPRQGRREAEGRVRITGTWRLARRHGRTHRATA